MKTILGAYSSMFVVVCIINIRNEKSMIVFVPGGEHAVYILRPDKK